MKTKITAILTLIAASVFAFAETAVEATKAPEATPAPQVCPAQPKKCPKARPQVSPEMREAFVQRILLSLSEEDLAKLAAKVSAVQKMTAEEKAEAVKALPKPEFRPQGKKCEGKPAQGPDCKCRKAPKGPKGPDCRGPKDDKKPGKCHGQDRRGHGPKTPGMKPGKRPQGAPLPPPPAQEAPVAEAPAADAPVAE